MTLLKVGWQIQQRSTPSILFKWIKLVRRKNVLYNLFFIITIFFIHPFYFLTYMQLFPLEFSSFHSTNLVWSKSYKNLMNSDWVFYIINIYEQIISITLKKFIDFRALNYGAIGTVLGHELTHGFDNSGRQYDSNGNLRQWWTNETIFEYTERTRCFIDHYNSYYEDEVYLH